MTPGTVCVDANLTLALYLPESFSPRAEALWHDWQSRSVASYGRRTSG
jgi:hypothetical protein